MLRQDRHLAGDQRQLAVPRLLKEELDLALTNLLRPVDCTVIEPEKRLSFRPQRFQREDHVIHGDRLAVVPARLRSQRKRDPGPIFRPFDRFGDEPVACERLVLARHQQRFRAGYSRRIALDDVRIEAVEGAGRAEPDGAAYRCLGIDVVEVREIWSILRLTIHRDRMPGVDHLVGREGARGIKYGQQAKEWARRSHPQVRRNR
jgi:hypothetical protein